jgi:hypothetical protein
VTTSTPSRTSTTRNDIPGLPDLETSDWIALAAVVIAALSWIDSRRALSREQADREKSAALLERQVSSEGAANLVTEHLGDVTSRVGDPTVLLSFTVRNAGRATARDISVEVVRFGENDLSMGWTLAETSVRGTLDRGERTRVGLHFPADEARRGDLCVVAYWEDDNGRREEDLGWLPPQTVIS